MRMFILKPCQRRPLDSHDRALLRAIAREIGGLYVLLELKQCWKVWYVDKLAASHNLSDIKRNTGAKIYLVSVAIKIERMLLKAIAKYFKIVVLAMQRIVHLTSHPLKELDSSSYSA